MSRLNPRTVAVCASGAAIVLLGGWWAASAGYFAAASRELPASYVESTDLAGCSCPGMKIGGALRTYWTGDELRVLLDGHVRGRYIRHAPPAASVSSSGWLPPAPWDKGGPVAPRDALASCRFYAEVRGAHGVELATVPLLLTWGDPRGSRFSGDGSVRLDRPAAARISSWELATSCGG